MPPAAVSRQQVCVAVCSASVAKVIAPAGMAPSENRQQKTQTLGLSTAEGMIYSEVPPICIIISPRRCPSGSAARSFYGLMLSRPLARAFRYDRGDLLDFTEYVVDADYERV
jgi:hypothetical protein